MLKLGFVSTKNIQSSCESAIFKIKFLNISIIHFQGCAFGVNAFADAASLIAGAIGSIFPSPHNKYKLSGAPLL